MNDPSIIITDATLSDADTIAHFMIDMAWETESKKLDLDEVRQGVRTMINEPERGQYFVAKRNGEVIGCIMYTHEWSDWRNGDMWWIQSVYVRPDSRRLGVFRAMHAHVRSLAIQNKVVELRLYVEKQNHRAKSTYQSLGMGMTEYDIMLEDLRSVLKK
ncbi:MAG TPA: GNAT family N-acetyltransferase [Tepidisphaeraceae bacterium]|nr:GNAT family N-acetyltransferase [Tepidisphaeraceae bacterium]